MEVGKTVVLAIEPLDAVGDIVEKKRILLFTPQGIIEKFGNEQGNGELVLVEGDGGERMEQTGIGEFLQLQARAHIGLDLQYGQRLEELLFDLSFGRLRQADDKRKSTVGTGEEIDDKSRLTVFQ